ncbi:MAG: histone methyltransferase set1 [Pycnora praestabilis]|nr:MAG: histone methyltransferase set1 [Pycnora praestabilis]
MSSFAKFFPTAPAVLQQKHKKAAQERQRAKTKPTEVAQIVTTTAEIVVSRSPADEVIEETQPPNGLTGTGALVETISSVQEDNESVQGDFLNGVGSASSYSSTVSSIFSATNPPLVSSKLGEVPNLHASTPLTNVDSSPTGRAFSPSQSMLFPERSGSRVNSGYAEPRVSSPSKAQESMTPIDNTFPSRPQARVPGREVKGTKVTYDPELDKKLSSKEKRKIKPVYKNFGEEEDDNPPKDPRKTVKDYCRGVANKGKHRLRISPYSLKPYIYDAATSIGPGPPTCVVITGFDPLTPLAHINALFTSFGDVAETSNKTDPDTGSFVGVCLIRYRDGRPSRGGIPIPAVEAAKRAEKEGTGQRIGTHTIRVERDRDGRRWKHLVEKAVKAREAREAPSKPVEELKTEDIAKKCEPPPTAPKGPSGKLSVRPTEAPRLLARPAAASLVDTKPILEQIKRDPYIFIACCYVPVLGTSISHLEKRLRAFDWKAVKVDKTGYYIIFEDSRRGEEEATRCFKSVHMTQLFDYIMNMDCQPYGNPNYERSPSPERIKAEQREREEQERLNKEQEVELEEEKKQRAEDLDPVREVLELVRGELREKLLQDVRSRIAAPALYEYLDPDQHVAKRRKLGITDPRDSRRPGIHIERPDDTPTVGTPDSRAGFTPNSRKPLSASTLNVTALPRIRKGVNSKKENVGFTDERRRAVPKRSNVRPLHHRLHQFHDDEEVSDDERQTSINRDTEEQDSRPLSRMSMSSVASDNDENREFDDPMLNLSFHLKKKTKWTRKGLTTLEKQIACDDELFGISKDNIPLISIPGVEVEPDSSLVGEKEWEEQSEADVLSQDISQTPDQDSENNQVRPKKRPKAKKKSKKQVFEERELKKQQERVILEELLDEGVEEEDVEGLRESYLEEQVEEEPARAEVEWGVSADEPRRTVYDDADIVLDLDGWQNLIKDDEDLRFLREVMDEGFSADIGNVSAWAWKQKEIKALNRSGFRGLVRTEIRIEGYYVPNSTGSARTEGKKKILESEKSKYLPHRIRVQKAREEREAKATNDKDPVSLAEAAKLAAAKITSKSSSRSNRVNNRRLVADINAQKQVLSGDADVLRFNQLKKRKKPVKFARSAIHNWGLYAMENIAANDMIIEYVGEKVRQQVADMRERSYLKSGIGSSYLFRIDENTVIDATKRGGIARFINHSCTPNCTAKIIKVEGSKRIVIYALRDIANNEELTYDYKFEREFGSDDRIPCLCGSTGCKGFLN